MKNITYISAGAGSGKTYTLTHKLAELFISDPTLRPEQIILTTFTRRAAAELMNRTRELLCEQGYYAIAARLDNALIGTVHSIGHALITKYWYYLGVSPNLNILDDKGLTKYIDLTVGSTAETDDINFFHKIAHIFEAKSDPRSSSSPLDWKDNLKKILEKSHNFGVSDFNVCIEKSYELIDDAYRFDEAVPDTEEMVDIALKVLPQLYTKCKGITRKGSLANAKAVMEAVTRVVHKFENYKESKKKYSEQTQSSRIKPIDLLPWFTKGDIKDIKDKTKTNSYRFSELDDFQDACDKLVYCPASVELMKEYVRRVFNLATKWEKNYADYKKRHCILDYNDIEKFLKGLLDIPEVKNEIRLSYKYLMVDEFQDCNSVQIDIFKKLADLMQHTWWVGDPKQSIYAFRGSNTQLVETVTADVKHGVDGCIRENLPDSYRSVPALVGFANKVFTNVFVGMENVCLNATQKECKEIEPVMFVRVPLVGRQREKNPGGVANMVASMITDAAYKGVATKLGDFAVLARKNGYVMEIAQALRNLGIPVCAESDVEQSREWMLLSSVLILCEDHDNELARATIAHLVAEGYTVPAIIDSKLEYDSTHDKEKKWLSDDVPLINATIKFSVFHRHLSLSSFVKAAIKALGLEAYSEAWSDGCSAIWSALANKAEEYEAKSIALGKNPTIQGFIKDESAKKPSVADKDAVHVLTYHGAKGLQWPVTILLSLDDDHVSPTTIVDKEIYNVSSFKDSSTGQNIICLLPQVTNNPLASVVANLERAGHVKREADRVRSEESRLLYVGVTRASHQLVLVTHKKDDANPYNWFKEMGISPDMGLIKVPFEVSPVNVTVNIQHTPVCHPCATVFNHREPMHVSPSQSKAKGVAVKVAELGQRFTVTDKDVTTFGSCVHQIYCGLDRNHTPDFAQSLIDSYGVKASVLDIIEMWDKFVDYLTTTYGEAISVNHELAFKQAVGGQIVSGSIDYAWNTADGCVLIDYKTFPGKIADALNSSSSHYAGLYKGQLDCYTTALEKAGRMVIDRLIFYPSLGLVVKVN